MSKILIVDDSNLARRSLRKVLEEMGHTVEEASDGEQAIERYFIERPDIVFLDIVMSGMYGTEVLEKLRELDPTARIIMATADIQSSTREIVKSAGASGVLNKPFTSSGVAEILARLEEKGDGWN